MPATSHWLALAVPAGFRVVASVEVRLHTRGAGYTTGQTAVVDGRPDPLCELPSWSSE
jgi:hypothetical protein